MSAPSDALSAKTIWIDDAHPAPEADNSVCGTAVCFFPMLRSLHARQLFPPPQCFCDCSERAFADAVDQWRIRGCPASG